MTPAQAERQERQSVRAVSRALVPDERLRCPAMRHKHVHLRSRLTTFAILIDDAIEAVQMEGRRFDAFALVLVTDFCWQVLRALGGRAGDDSAWIEAALPADHAQSDADIGDRHFARQIEIVGDAKWVFGLHSALRHPASALAEQVWLLREPIPQAERDRLLRAARGVQGVLRNVEARMA